MLTIVRNKEVKVLSEKEAKSCPWCGTQPTIQSWHGGRPTKKFIGCEGEDCVVTPQVTGETRREALANWNTRKS